MEEVVRLLQSVPPEVANVWKRDLLTEVRSVGSEAEAPVQHHDDINQWLRDGAVILRPYVVGVADAARTSADRYRERLMKWMEHGYAYAVRAGRSGLDHSTRAYNIGRDKAARRMKPFVRRLLALYANSGTCLNNESVTTMEALEPPYVQMLDTGICYDKEEAAFMSSQNPPRDMFNVELRPDVADCLSEFAGTGLVSDECKHALLLNPKLPPQPKPEDEASHAHT